ncbi:MAG: DUF721 domain-containing protein [Hyphomicrobiales bacterium]|nr:DUF721 domain-containing protein [Hyphomicrobiales bacterium]
MNKPRRTFARPLADIAQQPLRDAFARQGFASTALVTRWDEIVGADIAAHSQPEKIQWPRPFADQSPAPGTLWLRVEGPTAIEIQHLSSVILERVNRFFGWQAVDRLRLRQAPIKRRVAKAPTGPDPATTAEVAAGLTEIVDDDLRNALARLGAAIKST